MGKHVKCFDHIAKYVRKIRLETRSVLDPKIIMPQVEMSRLLGYKNGQFVSNIERGKCSLAINKVCLFCQITNTKTDPILKELLYDYQMTFFEKVIKDPKKKAIRFELDL